MKVIVTKSALLPIGFIAALTGCAATTLRSELTPAVADCGTTMGIDYLKDPRTKTRVAFGILAIAEAQQAGPQIQEMLDVLTVEGELGLAGLCRTSQRRGWE